MNLNASDYVVFVDESGDYRRGSGGLKKKLFAGRHQCAQVNGLKIFP